MSNGPQVIKFLCVKVTYMWWGRKKDGSMEKASPSRDRSGSQSSIIVEYNAELF